MLSTYWFLYMAGMGIFFPFFALYLRENAGLDGTEAGIVYATIPAVGLFAPAFWGRVADRSTSRSRVLAGVVAGTGFSYFALGNLDGFVVLALGTALLAFFSTATMPLGVSVSLSALGPEGRFRFGSVRVWGTVGFLVLVVAFPSILDLVAPPVAANGAVSEPRLATMFPIAGGLTLVAALVALRFGKTPMPKTRPADGDRPDLISNPALTRMLVFGFLAYLFLQGPMNFFPTYVRDRGGSLETISALWLIMLIPEIPLVALTGAALRRIGARGLLAGGVFAGGVRWILCALTHEEWIIYPAQALHGALVAGLLVGGPLYVDVAVPERLRSTSQGLLAMAGVGIGGIASSIATGWILDRFGIDAVYLIGGLGALALSLATRWILPDPVQLDRRDLPP